jgi:GxxExxY protein
MLTKKRLEEISYKVIQGSIEVHKELGPGLLESSYEECLIEELIQNGLKVDSQVYLPIVYKGKVLKSKFKIDLLVEDILIVELKAVEVMIPLFKAQLQTYMKLSKKLKGLIINFNTENITQSLISRVQKEYFELP